jgi:hypothetical protein
MNKEIREQINKVKNFGQFLNEDNKGNPHKSITYIIELKVLFEGFEYSTLKFKLLFPHYEEINDEKIKNSIEDRLKVFNNIVSYDILKSEEATGTDRILPMF